MSKMNIANMDIAFGLLAVFRSIGPYILGDAFVLLITVSITIGLLTAFHFKFDLRAGGPVRFAILATVCILELRGFNAMVSTLLTVIGLLINNCYIDNAVSSPTDWKGIIRMNVERCVHHYNKGLSQVDRTNTEWKLKRNATIDVLHYWFVQAHKYMERASDKLSDIKDEFDTRLKDLVENLNVLSDEINKTSSCLRGLKASLSSVEKDLKRKADNLKDMERQLERKKGELDETKIKHDIAKKAAVAALATAGGLLILAPFSAAALAGAAAADATALALVAVIIALEKDIKSLKNRIDSSREQCRLTSNEFENLKEDERKLESEESSNEMKMSSLKEGYDNMRKKTDEISGYLQQVKACCTVLGLIVNKFETLKEESDPEYCINLSVLKIPVQELENSMQQGMITF